MSADEYRPSRLEQLTAGAVSTLQRVGLSRLAYSAPLRRLGKRLLLRADEQPCVRQIASGLGKGLKLRVLPETRSLTGWGLTSRTCRPRCERASGPA